MGLLQGRPSALAVAAESHHSTYDRDLFPHWITISGACKSQSGNWLGWRRGALIMGWALRYERR
jgi:hypothetical protein